MAILKALILSDAICSGIKEKQRRRRRKNSWKFFFFFELQTENLRRRFSFHLPLFYTLLLFKLIPYTQYIKCTILLFKLTAFVLTLWTLSVDWSSPEVAERYQSFRDWQVKVVCQAHVINLLARFSTCLWSAQSLSTEHETKVLLSSMKMGWLKLRSSITQLLNPNLDNTRINLYNPSFALSNLSPNYIWMSTTCLFLSDCFDEFKLRIR